MKMHNYTSIKLWHEEMGSTTEDMFAQLLKAITEDAPADALYKNDDGEWVTLGQLFDRNLRIRLTTKLASA